MKNKIALKKYILKTSIATLLILYATLTLNKYEYKAYQKNYNEKLTEMITLIKKEYPNIKEIEIIKLLNKEKEQGKEAQEKEKENLKKYGIEIERSALIKENDKVYLNYLIRNIILLTLSITILLKIYLTHNHNQEKKIENITKYIEQINQKNYTLQIDDNTEDELSILKNELYKVTITLKEAAENSAHEKQNLKKSLEDISHQLKTPLTSILILLDNIIDDEEMNEKTKNEFIREIKRETKNIEFLVQNLLKLSKFDANTIHFQKTKIEVEDLVATSIKNVSTLCDLRNIEIKTKKKNNPTIEGDEMWQIEAITNILKNALDHSKDNSLVELRYEENNAYTQIEIENYGEEIPKEEEKHIFERFYKGKNAKKDSIGIGLSLSKTIIERANGTIQVASTKEKTTFTIKYFKI